MRVVALDDVTVALRLLVDRRDGLGYARTDLLKRIQRLLLELLPGGAKKFLSADQAARCIPYGCMLPISGYFREERIAA